MTEDLPDLAPEDLPDLAPPAIVLPLVLSEERTAAYVAAGVQEDEIDWSLR